jgi:hypothetical protein
VEPSWGDDYSFGEQVCEPFSGTEDRGDPLDVLRHILRHLVGARRVGTPRCGALETDDIAAKVGDVEPERYGRVAGMTF